jgi:cell division septal protein FtsQ
MKLKPQPRRAERSSSSRRGARAVRPGRGRGARRPGTPLTTRVGARLPSLRRVLAGLGALATAAVLVALLHGPWLRVTAVGWSGDRYTDAGDLHEALEAAVGASILALDTTAIGAGLEELPAVERATVRAGLDGRLEAAVVEHEAAFVWITRTARLLGAQDGTIFARGERRGDIDAGLEALPHVRDDRFVGRFIDVGDVVPPDLLRTALRLGELDPGLLGSEAEALSVRLDD